MDVAVLTGSLAGVAMGYVLHRGQLCFHAMFAGAWHGRLLLLRGWALAVGVGSVGLAVVYLLPVGAGLSTGLPFRPVGNVAGGLLIGWGMAIAQSCVSGLLYKFGAGMAGAALGLVGWMAGEVAAGKVTVPGPTLLPGGDDATIPGLLGLPRLVVAVVLLAVIVGVLRGRSGGPEPRPQWQWNWPTLGAALGVVLVLGWVLAALGGVDFGPSTVGASAGVAAGTPNWWLIAFLLGIVVGGAVAALHTGTFALRGETKIGYLRLLLGGFLLGAGGVDRWWLQPRARSVRDGPAQRLLHRRRDLHGLGGGPRPSDDAAATARADPQRRLIEGWIFHCGVSAHSLTLHDMTTTGRAAPLSPDLRRTALIEQTLPLLRAYGDAVTTRQIAEACGVAEGTIFRAFPDKESLITAALDKALDPTDMIAEIARIDPALRLEPRLRAAAEILYDRLTGVFALLGAMRLTRPPAQAPNSSCRDDHQARQAKIIEAVAGLLRPDDHLLRRSPTEVAQLLRALIFSGAHPLIGADAPLDSEEIVSILLDGVRRTAEDDARC